MGRPRRYKDRNRVQLLPLTVRPREFEPASGLIRRLALRAGHACPRSFLRTVPNCSTTLLAEFDRGNSIETLSRMSGIDLNFIRRSTAVVTDDGAYLGNVQITKTVQFANHQGRGPGGRVCPECLLEDREFTEGPLDCRPFRRFWWDFAEFHGCPRHRRALIDTCPGCMQPLEKNSLRPDYCFCGFDLALAPPGDRSMLLLAGAHESY